MKMILFRLRLLKIINSAMLAAFASFLVLMTYHNTLDIFFKLTTCLVVYAEQQSRNLPSSVGQQFPINPSGVQPLFPLHAGSSVIFCFFFKETLAVSYVCLLILGIVSFPLLKPSPKLDEIPVLLVGNSCPLCRCK